LFDQIQVQIEQVAEISDQTEVEQQSGLLLADSPVWLDSAAGRLVAGSIS